MNGFIREGEEPTFTIGQRVFFWTGRGSHGHGVIRAINGSLFLIDPEPDAVRGSDHRILRSGRDYWGPRDRGVRHAQINTPPRPWFVNN